MKRSERDAWLEALRSGKYNQTKGHLKRRDSYCCLGVLCDLDGVHWVPRPGHPQLFEFFEGTPYSEQPIAWYGTISNERARKAGIADFTAHLISMNDAGSSFAQIADWIESNVPVEEG